MFKFPILRFGVILLLMDLIKCLGVAIIENQCRFEVYAWSVANVTNATTNSLTPGIGGFAETFRTNPNGGGISLKIATTQNDSIITQFEYTYHTNESNVYYDISNVNGYPFAEWGIALNPSFTNCSSIVCTPEVLICSNVYNEPNDDYAVKSCDTSSNLTLTLCPWNRSPPTPRGFAHP